MPGNGVLFALDGIDEARLLAQPTQRARVAWCAGEVEERWDRDWLYVIGDSWFCVHYCLHGSSAFPVAGSPAEARAIFGGEPIGLAGVYSIDYKSGEVTRRIASALGKMRDEAIWARAGLIERANYEGSKGPGAQADVVDAVHALKDFYRKAAEAGRAVVFTVDM